jgi:hypothetical protein
MIERLTLMAWVATAMLAAGCGTGPTVSSVPCEGVGQLQFGTAEPTPVCKLEVSLGALAGSPMLQLDVTLPPRGHMDPARSRRC